MRACVQACICVDVCVYRPGSFVFFFVYKKEREHSVRVCVRVCMRVYVFVYRPGSFALFCVYLFYQSRLNLSFESLFCMSVL